MVDEMYLQKGSHFHCGEYIGANDDELYKGIMVFMITSLKITVPLVIKACNNELSFSRDSEMYFSSYKDWIFLLEPLLWTIIQPMWMHLTFYLISLRVTNVSNNYSPFFPQNISIFWLSTFIKNIRNSLLNWKKFVFPGFAFEISNIHIFFSRIEI